VDHSQVFHAMMPELTGAASARIAVAYPSFPAPLPLVRLDRRGLVFRATGAMPVTHGLPREATLLAGNEPLCSLRLVVRDVIATGAGRYDVTMQPSCAASDELLWHALRDCARSRHIETPLAPVDAAGEGAQQASIGDNMTRLSRRAAFRLTSRYDTLFFADWLEYHFDELRALAQQRAPQLQLNQLERRVTGDAVGVRFVYDVDGVATRHALNDCAREACSWIETEMRDKFALPIAQERFGTYRAHGACA